MMMAFVPIMVPGYCGKPRLRDAGAAWRWGGADQQQAAAARGAAAARRGTATYARQLEARRAGPASVQTDTMCRRRAPPLQPALASPSTARSATCGGGSRSGGDIAVAVAHPAHWPPTEEIPTLTPPRQRVPPVAVGSRVQNTW